MVSAYENVHIRSNLPRLEEATKYANSAGDRCAIHLQKVIFVKLDICRMYTSLANFYYVQTKLFIGQPRMPLFAFWSLSRVSDERLSGRTCWCGGRGGDVFNSFFFLL
jgi:hypothetical protein